MAVQRGEQHREPRRCGVATMWAVCGQAAPPPSATLPARCARFVTRFALLDSPRLLFWGPTLIWASTWHVILYQLAETPALDAVALRFALASALLALVVRLRGEVLRIPWRWHGWLALTGTVQYSVNYWCVYEAERHVPSGLVAVLFSLMVFGNAAVGWLLLGQTVSRRFLGAAAGGVAGVALIFWPEVLAAGARPNAALGLGIGLLAVGCASVGNGLTLRLSHQGVPLVPVLAHGMGYGSLLLLALALARGDGLRVGHSAAWWLSLAYLAAFGTVTAFVLYFKLAQRRGPARAALTGIAIPPLALAISAALEGWQPTLPSLAGVALCIGSVYAATRAPPPPAATTPG
jgi:drug/metabolite transporter (DMT)-like permease